jgi:hypothetical protein
MGGVAMAMAVARHVCRTPPRSTTSRELLTTKFFSKLGILYCTGITFLDYKVLLVHDLLGAAR